MFLASVYNFFVKTLVQTIHALIIDDEAQVGNFIARVLSSNGWQVTQARSAEEAFQISDEQPWLLIFCDVMLIGTDGYAVLRHFSKKQSGARFVLMTGQGSAAGALDATAFGAYDYLVKPFGIEDILKIANAVLEQHRIYLQAKNADLSPLAQGYKSDILLIGKSPKFVECLKMVGRVAVTDHSVMITGESGTGKEVVARAVHLRSRRAAKPFVAVNCGAISAELIESELFGHARGSFTGASSERVGLWEEANGGTIFLDEITETSLLFQVKLLRALQEGEIRRVGSNQTLKLDVRVITASNRDVKEEVAHGRFRKDLMYRLNAFIINLPPLRERPEDILLLAEYFARRARPDEETPVQFSPDAVELLKSYDWEGNIRELENAVIYAMSLCEQVVYPEHLPDFVRQNNSRTPSNNAPEDDDDVLKIPLGKSTDDLPPLSEVEEKYVMQILSRTGGNKQAAARLLRIDPKTLNRIVERSNS